MAVGTHERSEKRFKGKLELKKNFFAAAALIVLSLASLRAQTPWKGNSIIGNGNLCIVYSDDPRIEAKSKGKGIQHFYYKDYTMDYISSSSFELDGEKTKDSIGMKDFFSPVTFSRGDNFNSEILCYTLPEDAAVLSYSAQSEKEFTLHFTLTLRKKFVSDQTVNLEELKVEKDFAVARWSNGTTILVAPKENGFEITASDSVITFTKKISGKSSSEILIIPSASETNAVSLLQKILRRKILYAEAKSHWSKWIDGGKVPQFSFNDAESQKYIDYFKRTLYAVKAADLNGQIPADMTGQFVTNNMPQLYPRDAMMCARVFLLTNHLKEAEQVIKFWVSNSIPKKSKGEFYARYDARTKAVDAGSGARYDEPEWDANGYLIQLLNMYHDKTKKWLTDKNFIYGLADFLVSKIDDEGLLYEGGIVEWTGYLPATNMTCAAALQTASSIAKKLHDNEKAKLYKEAAEKISSSLNKMIDADLKSYTDVRYHAVKTDDNRSISDKRGKKLFLWDTSAYFGILWGYPDHMEFKLSNSYMTSNNVGEKGGMKYFQAYDNAWLSGYGGDLFFFTTAASSEYNSLHGSSLYAKMSVDWMIRNSNSYGLMPERIYSNLTDCSDASPLSWCNAEFAAAVLLASPKMVTE